MPISVIYMPPEICSIISRISAATTCPHMLKVNNLYSRLALTLDGRRPTVCSEKYCSYSRPTLGSQKIASSRYFSVGEYSVWCQVVLSQSIDVALLPASQSLW